MCLPNDPDELRRIFNEADYIDRCIELLKPRSPRAGGEQIPAPSLPAAGAGDADSRLDFDRDSQTLEERCAPSRNLYVPLKLSLHGIHNDLLAITGTCPDDSGCPFCMNDRAERHAPNPGFCYTPERCAGKTCCPHNPSCTE